MALHGAHSQRLPMLLLRVYYHPNQPTSNCGTSPGPRSPKFVPLSSHVSPGTTLRAVDSPKVAYAVGRCGQERRMTALSNLESADSVSRLRCGERMTQGSKGQRINTQSSRPITCAPKRRMMHGVQLKQLTDGEEKETSEGGRADGKPANASPFPEHVGAPASSSSGNGSSPGAVGNIVIADHKKKKDMHDIDKNIAEVIRDIKELEDTIA